MNSRLFESLAFFTFNTHQSAVMVYSLRGVIRVRSFISHRQTSGFLTRLWGQPSRQLRQCPLAQSSTTQHPCRAFKRDGCSRKGLWRLELGRLVERCSRDRALFHGQTGDRRHMASFTMTVLVRSSQTRPEVRLFVLAIDTLVAR